MRSLARKIWLVVGMVAVAILAYNVGLLVLGYPTSSNPEEVAEWIVQGHRDPSLCFKMNTGIGMGPSSGTIQRLCVHIVAKKMKSPEVCELLMPSSYGLSCVGAASEAPICGMNTGFEVQWHEGDQIKRSSLKDCQKSNGRSERGNACCIIASVSGIRSFNDCSSLAMDVPLLDNCLNELAFKNKNPSSCVQIKDDNIRMGCIVSAKALQKDPSICTGCTPPVEDVEQIPK